MGVPFSFVHAADLHLDSPFRGLSDAPAAIGERLRESTFAALRGLVDLALEERVDFVVVAGDLFDAADRSLRAQLRLQRALSELTEAGIGVYLVYGNHDPESGRQAKLEWPRGVVAFGSAAVEHRPAYTRSGELAAFVYGISYKTAAVTDNLALRFARADGASFHLAVLHANVDGNPAYDNYAPCRLDELSRAGFDYWALGHVHDRRVLREYPHVVYPGNLQGRSIRETGGKGAYVVKVAESGAVELLFRDLADVLWREAAVPIDGIEREQELKDRLLDTLERIRADAGGRPSVVRLRLTGRGALHEALLEPRLADEWLGELREWAGDAIDARSDGWVWPESLVVRTAGELELRTAADEDGFVGELVRAGLAAAEDVGLSEELFREAVEDLRRQPAIREWLDSRSHAERAAWIERALELAVSLLREGRGA